MSDVIQPGEYVMKRSYNLYDAFSPTGWLGPERLSRPVWSGEQVRIGYGGLMAEFRRATPGELSAAGIGTEADKPRQVRLTRSQIVSIRKAAKHIRKVFQHIPTPQGVKYWEQLCGHLLEMADHGTNDGEPWQEEPVDQDRIPTGEDAKQRPLCMFRDSGAMHWSGPRSLIYVDEKQLGVFPFRDCEGDFWPECRFATKEEVEASNAE